jgi:ribosome-binding ATPase YchF (GTP1/OBG family)
MELNLWNQLSNNMNTLKNEFDLISTTRGKFTANSSAKTDSKEFRKKRINNIFQEVLSAIEQLQGIKRGELEQEKAEKELVKIFRQLKRKFKKNAVKLSNIQEDLEDNRECYLMTNVY